MPQKSTIWILFYGLKNTFIDKQKYYLYWDNLIHYCAFYVMGFVSFWFKASLKPIAIILNNCSLLIWFFLLNRQYFALNISQFYNENRWFLRCLSNFSCVNFGELIPLLFHLFEFFQTLFLSFVNHWTIILWLIWIFIFAVCDFFVQLLIQILWKYHLVF